VPVSVVLLGVVLRVGAYLLAGGLTLWEARPVLYHLSGKDPAGLTGPVRWALAFAGEGPAEVGRLLSLAAALAGLVVGAFLVTRLCPGRWRLLGLLLLAIAPGPVLEAARLSPRAMGGLVGALAALAALPGPDGAAPRRFALIGAAVAAALAGVVSFHSCLPLAGVAAYWIVRGLRGGWRGGTAVMVAVLGGALVLSLFVGGPAGIPEPGLPPDNTGWPPYLPGIADPVTWWLDAHASWWANLFTRGVGAGSSFLWGAAVLLGMLSAAAGSAPRVAAAAWLAVAWGAALLDPQAAPMAHPAAIPLVVGLAAAGCGSITLRGTDRHGTGLRIALAAGLVVPASLAVASLEKRALLGCEMAPLLKDLAHRLEPGDRIVHHSDTNPVVRLAIRRVKEFPADTPIFSLRDDSADAVYPGLAPGAPPSRVWLVFAGEHPDVTGHQPAVFRAYVRRAEVEEILRRPGAVAYLFRTGAP
jgi:hypothetical protein